MANAGKCVVTTVAAGQLTRVPVGADLQQQALNSPEACAAECCALAGCGAFLFEPHTDAHMGGCVPGKSCCFLKSQLGKTTGKNIEGE